MIVGLNQIADELANTPREEARDCEALIFSKSRASRRIKALAKQIEVIEPITARSGAPPRLARIATRPRQRKPANEGQMILALV